MGVVAEEGKLGWRWVRKCVPGVRCQAMECKGGFGELVVCGLHE